MKTYLIAYDISSNKRRKKVSDLLETYGVRVNKSVFFCQCKLQESTQLMHELQSLIDKHDQVLWVPLCKSCTEQAIVLNQTPNNQRKNRTTFVG